jgi:quinol monooxygenase YgiN
MLIVHVHVHVKPEFIDSFKQATVDNAANSVHEPGIARFDVLQQAADPARFLLVEVYRTPEAAARHKETQHYQAWYTKVAEMMAEPRTREIYENVYPADRGW